LDQDFRLLTEPRDVVMDANKPLQNGVERNHRDEYLNSLEEDPQ
jgi:hypothetical protein